MKDQHERSLEVHHNIPEHRFETTVDGHRCVCDYHQQNGEMVFTHTYVAPELRGRGLAEKLVRAALDYARQESFRVVPECSYVAAFIRRHREYVQLTT